jgi:hypothetical protein
MSASRLVFLFILIASSFVSRGQGDYTFETECMGVEMDGSVTLKAWGNGRNYFDALEQAKKVAVRDVVFKGIQNGKSDCSRVGLVLEPRAQETYEDYFAKFLADDGEYLKYVNLKDEKLNQKRKRDKKEARESVTLSAIVRVDRLALKRRLVEDGIIK